MGRHRWRRRVAPAGGSTPLPSQVRSSHRGAPTHDTTHAILWLAILGLQVRGPKIQKDGGRRRDRLRTEWIARACKGSNEAEGGCARRAPASTNVEQINARRLAPSRLWPSYPSRPPRRTPRIKDEWPPLEHVSRVKLASASCVGR